MIEPSVDLEELVKRVGGPDKVRHLARLVEECWPEDFLRLQESLEERNGTALKDAAHTMKGNLSNLAAERGRNLAWQLEQAALQLDWDTSRHLIASLHDECQSIQRELSAVSEATFARYGLRPSEFAAWLQTS